MSRLLSFQTLGTAHNAPRFWVEGQRLTSLGFSPGTPISIEVRPQSLRITPAILGEHLISSRRDARTLRPILDLNSHRLLSHLAPFGELKVHGSTGSLIVSPSVRAFSISRHRSHTGPFRVLDLFAGGGTLSDALTGNAAFRLAAGLEIEPAYADEFSTKHPDADLILANIRHVLPEDLPPFDVLIGGIPCSEHSNLGRAKKGLAGRPEVGELGDLFIHVLHIVSARLPVACVFENVPSFGTSLAGETFVAHLRRLGYAVTTSILDPHSEWNEPSTRCRWVCVATLRPGFSLSSPHTPFVGTLAAFLDAEDPIADAADAARIATTIEGLRRHNARHAEAGHGFSMCVLDRSATSAPTICKSYHKINSSGFFVSTPFGPRLLRKHEIARINGQRILSDHYATAVEMMGQGVLTRVFASVFNQLGSFLSS